MSAIKYLKIKLIAYTADSYPGWVLCSFQDVKEKNYEFEEKVPVVTAEYYDKNTVYPQEASVECEILNVTGNIATVNLSKPLGIEIDGNSIFQVFTDQLLDS